MAVTYGNENNCKRGNLGVFLAILAVAVALISLAVSTEAYRLSVDHAVERHGNVAVTIKNHCESNPKVTMTRSMDGRKAVGCEYKPGKVGVSIYEEDGDHVTSFPNKSNSLSDLLKYFKNRGYQ